MSERPDAPPSREPQTSRIEGGIEWYEVSRNGNVVEEDSQCARCGSSTDAIPCNRCGGEGGYFGEEIASGYDYGWIDPDEWYTCAQCRGRPYVHHCISTPEWCAANPIPGREHIVSTAMNSEAWNV